MENGFLKKEKEKWRKKEMKSIGERKERMRKI